jgi:tetratricopeptide (TPR) repeat protein
MHTYLNNRNVCRAYKKGIELYPDHSSIYLKYAGFLRHVRRNINAAEDYYKLAAALCDDGSQPKSSSGITFKGYGSNAADAFGSYASFLHGVHHKIDQAEYYYKKAVEADETHANNLCNYGLFLR